MKQKLGIIQAIMENQNLLVLDEPFNALDEKSVKLFRELLIEYKKQEKLIILTSLIIRKITFSDTKSYPDCLPVGNAEKVYLFRYPITRRREMNYSKQLLQFQIGADRRLGKENSEVWQTAHFL